MVGLFLVGGYLLGTRYEYSTAGALTGLFLGILVLFVEKFFQKIVLGRIFGAFLGLITGLLFAKAILVPLKPLLPEKLNVVNFALSALLGYSGMLIGAARGKSLTISGIIRILKGQTMETNQKILDTSVIIDGRIADVCETGFIEGTLVVPQFILRELQHIADSPDHLRRARGRRGLDILHRMQKMSNISVKIVEEELPHIKEVDSKLVALAKILDAKILTNDFNLNKVAELQGVPVLNINELANALKPVVLPGESMNVFVLKEGKEPNQGVAYMDDGTMVVVENGRRYIGQNINVTVTSVLQTTAGRMIFTRVKEEFEKEEVRTRR
jgi:uncharacterized protein YacL